MKKKKKCILFNLNLKLILPVAICEMISLNLDAHPESITFKAGRSNVVECILIQLCEWFLVNNILA